MILSLYITNNGEVEMRNGGLTFYLPKGFSTDTPFNKNVKLIEIGKQMDTFNYDNQKVVDVLKSKIESIYDFNLDLKFIINFAIEESKITNEIINFYKKILHNKTTIYLTNNINYAGIENFIFYNSNGFG